MARKTWTMAALLLCAQPALAGDWFVHGGVTATKFSSTDTREPEIPFNDLTDIDVDDKDVGGSIGVGYVFGDRFGLNASYSDLGTVSVDGTLEQDILIPGGGRVTSPFSTKADVSTIDVDAFGCWALTDRIDVIGSVGLQRFNHDVSATSEGRRLNVSDQWQPTVGAGLRIWLSEAFGLSIGARQSLDSDGVTTLSAGIVWSGTGD